MEKTQEIYDREYKMFLKRLEELRKPLLEPLIKEYGKMIGLKAKYTLFGTPVYIQVLGDKEFHSTEESILEQLIAAQSISVKNDNIFLEKGYDLEHFKKYGELRK